MDELGQLILGQAATTKGPRLEGLSPVLYDQVQAANNAYREQYGTDLPITRGVSTREEQQSLHDRAGRGEPNIFMPTNPAKEPNRQIYHEGAVDISANIPPEFAARMEKDFGLHRPYGAKDPVHWEVHPSFKPTAKQETDAYAPADKAIPTTQVATTAPSLGDLILGGTPETPQATTVAAPQAQPQAPVAVAPQVAGEAPSAVSQAAERKFATPVSQSGVEQLPFKNLTPEQQARGEEQIAKAAGTVDAILAMPAGLFKSLATAYMFLGEKAMPKDNPFPLEKREEIANSIGSALTPELAKNLGIDPNSKGYQEALLQKVGHLFEKGIDYAAEKTGLPKVELEALVNLLPFMKFEVPIKSAVASLKERFSPKPEAPRFEPKLEPTLEQLTPQEPATAPAAGNLQQQFEQKKLQQMPVTEAANEPIGPTPVAPVAPIAPAATSNAATQLEGQFQGLKGAGAAEVEQANLRQGRANQLDFPIQLSKDQATRNPADVTFARETAKDPVFGKKLQAKYAEDNALLQKNLDSAIESTGAELTGINPGELADRIVKVVEPERRRRYGEVNTAYTAARNAGEMSAPIEINPLVQYLDKNSSAATNAPVLTSVAAELKKLGKDKDTLSINDLEEVRKMVNNISEPGTPNGHYGKEINRLIDRLTEDQGGSLYKDARRLNAEFMTEFENTPVIRNLTAMKKGSTQRVVAMEDLIEKSLIRGSLDDVKQLFGSFERMGPAGESLAKELRGFVAEKIKTDSTKGVNRDINGRPYLSTAALDKIIVDLDRSGKLDYIFGAKQADKFRTINEVTKDLQTVPVGTTNTSGTAATLLGALSEMGAQSALGVTGMPIPVVMIGKHLYKNRQTAKKLNKIQEFLDYGKNL
jgi:hypothetical protein